jgi:hypothetical protein
VKKLKTRQRGIPASVLKKAQEIFDERQRAEAERLRHFGAVLPVIATHSFGRQTVGAGNKIFASTRWKGFLDFLWEYLPFIFGNDWYKLEAGKPEAERHPMMQWRLAVLQHGSRLQAEEDGSVSVPMNAFFMGYFTLAYDLYVLEQNSSLDDLFLKRLRHREHFQGARHELFAEATCLRAGFAIERENEADRSQRHAEFTALHKATGTKLSVEAKRKHRSGILGRPRTKAGEDNALKFAKLINEAAKKVPPHPLVIFLDTNLPARDADRFFPVHPTRLSRNMATLLDTVQKEHGGRDPYSLLIFTNLPYHYATPDDSGVQKHFFSTGPMPDAGESTAQMTALRAIHEAALLQGNIPREFPSNAN